MENMNSLLEWQPDQLLTAALVVLVVLSSLGFALWKALSDSQWTPYWHISSLFIAIGGGALAITASRLVVVDFMVNTSWALIIAGVVMALTGAVFDMIHRYNLHRDMQHHGHA